MFIYCWAHSSTGRQPAWHEAPNIIDINLDLKLYYKVRYGFWGSCFPKDVKAIVNYGEENGNDKKIFRNKIKINNDQPKIIIRDLSKITSFEHKNIPILWLAFKPGIDDLRESPAIAVVKELLKKI